MRALCAARVDELVGQLLHERGLASEWGPVRPRPRKMKPPTASSQPPHGLGQVVVSMAKIAVDTVDIQPSDSIDIKTYVKVKCIRGGSLAECDYTNGVVARKNVVHKRMRREITTPRILLLGCALEYQRRENVLTALSQLMEQEEEYLRILVTRITSLAPDLVLVEKTAARTVQDALRDANISLVLNVKRPLLQRIARCTGAEIIPFSEQVPAPLRAHSGAALSPGGDRSWSQRSSGAASPGG